MRPSGRHRLCASLALPLSLACLALTSRASAETLTITSTPPGAALDIDGMPAGSTPYKIDYPGGYFHKPHTVFAARLDHSMTVKISLDGYATEQVTLTQGPFEWESITGRRHGSYFLLKAARFDIKLDPLYHQSSLTATSGREGPLHPAAAAAFRAAETEPSGPAGVVAIASDPAGAEIYIDGKFVGQTPSTLHLAGGPHQVELKYPGKQSWSRDLEVLKDSQLTLHPVLAVAP
jgi:PEGA domain